MSLERAWSTSDVNDWTVRERSIKSLPQGWRGSMIQDLWRTASIAGDTIQYQLDETEVKIETY
jgi:hypothetical protein